MDIGTITFIIAQVLGIISWLLLLYSYTREDIDELLYVQIGVCLFDVLSYLLLGADAGLLICLVELIKTYLYYKTDLDKYIFYITFIVYALIGLLSFNAWYSILPVLGSILDSFGSSRDSKTANICSIISNTLWTIYDILILSYIGAFNDIVVVLCNISVLFLGYSRLMHISKFRIVKYNYLNTKTVNKIYDLDLKNYGKDYTWDRDYQMQVYKKNRDSMFVLKYKHEITGYINYLNIKEEEYNKLKNIKKMYNKIDLDSIVNFKVNKKNYLLIESIHVKKEYEKDQTIDIIFKKISSFIRLKHNKRIYIHGILAFALSDFENKIYKSLNFREAKKLDNITIYELNKEEINNLYLKKNKS